MDFEKIKLKMPGKLISAIIYFALIAVVLYGKGHNVYDGFGNAVPWIISAVFFVTGVFSLISYIRSVRVQNSVDEFANKYRIMRGKDLGK